MSKSLINLFEKTKATYPFLTEENFYRIQLLYHFVNYQSQESFPEPFSRIESIFSLPRHSKTPLLTLITQKSPFEIIDGGKWQKILLYNGEYVDSVMGYEQTTYDMKRKEPFYFFVKEVRGELVLKLNPIQLCDFFQNLRGEKPCVFCFRNDMVSRFRNSSSEQLVEHMLADKESAALLPLVDEISLITGSYLSDERYVKETTRLIAALKLLVRPDCRIVVGSHEGKGKKTFEKLKKAGVTMFAFPIESFDDTIRRKGMQNRKGSIPIALIVKDIEDAVEVFGKDGVIIRSVAGMGDSISEEFEKTIQTIRDVEPLWNINVYMPFTHYHWRIFNKPGRYAIEYLYAYMNTINKHIPEDRFWNFKISP